MPLSLTRLLTRPAARSSRGQALVETALILPILLILLLGAIDFGRLFFGWVNLNQAVRIGANYAATHPNMTTSERDEFELLIEGDTQALNCQIQDPLPNATYTTAGGAPTTDPTLGDYANLTVGCEFSMITPLAGLFFGETIDLSATSTFPVREGCVNCPTPVPATPVPTPVQCRLVPNMVGMSVAGARLAWESAGFLPANFTPASGQDTSTVAPGPVVTQPPLSTCASPNAQFDSSVTVTTVPPESPSCQVVPNVVGMTLGDALDAWADAGFTGAVTADGGDPATLDQNRVVTGEATTPASTSGVTCGDPTYTAQLTTGDPWPAPPDSPCRVPNMINLRLDEGQTAWQAAGFAPTNLTADGKNNFTIKSQSLVGGNWVPCDAAITVSQTPKGA